MRKILRNLQNPDITASPGWRRDVTLAPLTSFRVGGPAAHFFTPASDSDIAAALNWAREQGLPVFVLGKGTNLVVSDAGFNGLVLHLCGMEAATRWEGNHLIASAGASWQRLVTESTEQGFAGIEMLAGIPGTLGGAVYMNAGAFGQELGARIVRVRSVAADGSPRVRSREECGFAYRHSAFKGSGEVILEAEIELVPGDAASLRAQVAQTLARRREKQPLDLPNAGSVYKRPPGNFAGTLIEQCGLKGRAVGGARVSERHANFIVNAGGATAQDIFDLSEEVRAVVERETGVRLEKEVIFLGEFGAWPRPLDTISPAGEITRGPRPIGDVG